MKKMNLMRLIVLVVLIVGIWTTSAVSEEAPAEFKDEPAAHAVYDKMMETLRNAESLFYESEYRWEAEGRELGHSKYSLWMKKPNYALLEANGQDVRQGMRGVAVYDGEYSWVYWPSGRPRFGTETEEEHEKTRFNVYMKEPAPQGKHSIAHITHRLGTGMFMTVIQPSVFHGGSDSLDPYIDGIRSLGVEKVGLHECDFIEVSYMDHQRSKYLWISRRDHLPRKLKEVVRVEHDIVTHETWSDVRINCIIPDDKFTWKPPEGWQEFRFPTLEETLIKPGTEAPDFELASSDGHKIKLSDYRGKVVWLVIWRVGCPPCREEMPCLETAYKKHKDKGLVVLGFNRADDRKIALDFLKEYSATFPNVLDTSKKANEIIDDRYKCNTVPVNFIIDRNGIIADVIIGYDGEGDDRCIKAIEKLGIK